MAFLSIAVTSYNRPAELARCLLSIDLPAHYDYEVYVRDDASPKQSIIEEVLNTIHVPNLRHTLSSHNIGYDMNLYSAIRECTGEYVILMSDDDIFCPGSLLQLWNLLIKQGCSIGVSGYIQDDGNQFRLINKEIKHISFKPSAMGRWFYDFILFSGLIINRSSFLELRHCNYVNWIYSQVYYSSVIAAKYGLTYYGITLVRVCGDGENGFGKNDSAGETHRLSDRSTLSSLLNYHLYLFQTLHQVSKTLEIPLFAHFINHYLPRLWLLIIRCYTTEGKEGVLLLRKNYKMLQKAVPKLNQFSVITHTLFAITDIIPDRIGKWLFAGATSASVVTLLKLRKVLT